MQRSAGVCRYSYSLVQQRPVSLAGFTLLEIMIAVVIFSIGLLGLSSMQTVSIHLNSAAHLKTRIAAVGQEHMEVLFGQPYISADLADPAPVGQPTTYCVLYPNEGLSRCRCEPPTVGLNPCPDPAGPPFCVIEQQPFGSNRCDDTTLVPPTEGYKVRWSVDKNSDDSLAHVHILVSHKHPGQQQIKTFELSFAKSRFN